MKRERVEAVRAWGVQRLDGTLSPMSFEKKEKGSEYVCVSLSWRSVRVRIIRESDYRKLLRAAKRSKRK